ncbi:DUF3265 domain-containing protein [Vibrio parahaemolyticus]|nr:DUF3265 domain-containing protein [Vibrio parahaemolyticus]
MWCVFLILNTICGVFWLTNCLRGIRNAWHFHYALVLVFRVACGYFGIALLIP